ncbi:MAG: hypothetical protein HYX79_08280 [Chloroflexi bacterium]|nr:hypothetical protein [Chloroflexota bacterium]
MKKKLLIVATSVTLIIGMLAGVAFPAFAAQDGQENQPKKGPRAINGQVTEIDGGKTFFVVKSGQKDIKIAVDGNTQYFKASVPQKAAAAIKERIQKAKPQIQKVAPGLKQRLINKGKPANTPGQDQSQGRQANPASAPRLPGEPATFEDIAVGDRMMVRVVAGTDPPLAQQVLIVKVTPSPYAQITGTISVINGNDVTITGKDNATVTVTVDPDTNVVIKGALSVQAEQTAHAVYHKDTKIAKLLRVKPA